MIICSYSVSSSKEPSSSKSNQKTRPEEREEEERSGEKREKMKSSAESDSHHSHHHKRAKRSKHSNRTESGRPSSGHLTSETSRGDHSTTETSESSREKVWVAPNLRVRIVDTAFKRGRYYNSKVRHLSHSLYAVVQCSSTLLVCIYIGGVGWYIALFLGRLRLWMWSVVISVSVGQPMEYYLKVRMYDTQC